MIGGEADGNELDQSTPVGAIRPHPGTGMPPQSCLAQEGGCKPVHGEAGDYSAAPARALCAANALTVISRATLAEYGTNVQ